MKKILFLLSVAALLLPLDSSAQSKPKIKSVDFTIQVPTPGMSLFDAREMQFTSAKTEFGDLAATGGIQVRRLTGSGISARMMKGTCSSRTGSYTRPGSSSW